MLKTIAIFVVAAVVVSGTSTSKRAADKDFLLKENSILTLLKHVHQECVDPEIIDLAKTYNPEDHTDKYTNAEAVQSFLKLYKTGQLLKRNEIFSVSNEQQLQQAIKLFDLLYFAKDWDTFYKTACWARCNVNQGVFVYALCVAVLNRDDTQDLVLPPPSEINPNLFVKDEIIQKAYDQKMKAGNSGGKKTVVIENNNSNNNGNNLEKEISYFTEDIGLNSYQWNYHIKQPFWLSTDRHNIKYDRRGEMFWYKNQQLIKRYLTERLSNNLDEPRQIHLNEQCISGYIPNLRYKNGKAMSVRPEQLNAQNTGSENAELINDLERRIKDAIDLGAILDKNGKEMSINNQNGIDLLGRIIEQAGSSVNSKFYGNLYNQWLNLIGNIIDPQKKHNTAPSAIQNYETMLRDPSYYRLWLRINQLFKRLQKCLPVYTRQELLAPDVSIEDVQTDKLVTYLEKFDVDITNAVTVNSPEDSNNLQILARQQRLNHKPFTIQLNVNSGKDTKSVVRIFIAPSTNNNGLPLNLKQKQKYMFEIDRFVTSLKTGKNLIKRKSQDMACVSAPSSCTNRLTRNIEDALQGKSAFYINENCKQCGIPENLLLPKGNASGKKFSLVVVASLAEDKDLNETNLQSVLSCGTKKNTIYPDKKPMGFPFDREIDESEFLNLPNIVEKEVVVYHKQPENKNQSSDLNNDITEEDQQ